MADIRIESGAARVIRSLRAAGHDAYAVGGCVRDALLGHTPSDWDICTSALPQQTLALFGEEQCIPTGIKHGTVTVKMDGGLYEVTTFRTEGSYSDGRHPDSVDFVRDVRLDLSRRDFTINAMAYSEETGLIDPFGGQEDLLARGIVRAVGEPMRRFSEDALRIMRLFRFAARFGFPIERQTLRSAIALRENLRFVSGERIREELMKLLASKSPGAYLPQEIVSEIIPQMEKLSREDYAETLRALDALPPDAPLRLAALLKPLCGEDDVSAAQQAMKRLRCANRTASRVCTAIIGVHSSYPGEDDALRVRARCLLGKHGPDALEDILSLSSVSCGEEKRERIARLAAFARDAKAQGLCCRVADLAVGGRDVMQALSSLTGPAVGAMLDRLLQGVIQGSIDNEREALIAAAKRFTGEQTP